MDFLAFAPPAQGSDPSSQMTSMLFMLGLMVVVMYFFIIRPQKKRQDDQQKMVDSLKNGDKVVLSSGIHGTISSVDDKTAMVNIADNVKVRVEKVAIVSIVPKAEKTEKSEKSEKSEKADTKADAK
jgi:preprotein translocase subunit YajC